MIQKDCDDCHLHPFILCRRGHLALPSNPRRQTLVVCSTINRESNEHPVATAISTAAVLVAIISAAVR